MWFASSVVERRNGLPEPVEPHIFSTPVTFGAHRGATHVLNGYCFSTSRTFPKVSLSPEFETILNLEGHMQPGTGIQPYIARQIDMWIGSSGIECRNGIPEALGSNPGRAGYFFTACYTTKFSKRLLTASQEVKHNTTTRSCIGFDLQSTNLGQVLVCFQRSRETLL